MKIEFGYGCGSQTLCVPDENVLGVLQQNELALPEKTARELVAEAIAHPIGHHSSQNYACKYLFLHIRIINRLLQSY